tara:strand:+ start:1616 stop:2011 length:396 start_codon:yes stop_codon:yes gene_type:complete
MKLLTIDNARGILEKGEIYRIGTNALNVLEFTYEHKGFKKNNPTYKDSPFLKDAETLYLNGAINWLDIEMEEQKTDFRFHAVKKPNAEDKRFEWGVFCAWNGEPLWLLDDYETTDEIMLEWENEMMLPDYE